MGYNPKDILTAYKNRLTMHGPNIGRREQLQRRLLEQALTETLSPNKERLMDMPLLQSCTKYSIWTIARLTTVLKEYARYSIAEKNRVTYQDVPPVSESQLTDEIALDFFIKKCPNNSHSTYREVGRKTIRLLASYLIKRSLAQQTI